MTRDEFLACYEGNSEDYAHAVYVTRHKPEPYAESDIDLVDSFYFGHYSGEAEVGEEWWLRVHDGYSAETIEEVLSNMRIVPMDFWESLGRTVMELWRGSGCVLITEEDSNLISGVYVFMRWSK